ncbi:hypothetical protein C0991_011663, partial [Blastosporella zonata]
LQDRRSSVPQPYFGAEMPEVIKRDGGVEVVHVDPTLPKVVADTDAHWEKRAEQNEKYQRKREERERREQKKKEEQKLKREQKEEKKG